MLVVVFFVRQENKTWQTTHFNYKDVDSNTSMINFHIIIFFFAFYFVLTRKLSVSINAPLHIADVGENSFFILLLKKVSLKLSVENICLKPSFHLKSAEKLDGV